MDVKFKQGFPDLWKKHFPGAELPIIFYYTNEEGWGGRAGEGAATECVICDLERVRAGKTLVLDVKSTKCGGGKRYLGFSQRLRPDFEFFLSCGIPGKLEGERYKKTPQLVMQQLGSLPTFEAPGQYIVFKRWDKLEVDEVPLAVTFFASPDVLSGLFSLANFDSPDVNNVIAPSGSGCATIVYYPLIEAKSTQPRCVLGMFDVSARSCIDANMLTFSVPMARFTEMVWNMDESFLTTRSWKEVRDRIKG
jgi:uncharacterized protein (DUF169 family)